MIDRILGVFKLDADTFEQIEHDQSATTQAALVVLVVALAGIIGNLFGAVALRRLSSRGSSTPL